MKGRDTPATFATAAQVVAMGSLRKRSRMSSETSTGVKERSAIELEPFVGVQVRCWLC